MVGLKSFWMTFSLLLMVASCVPQSKKSECRETEAFNTQLRSCVPVVQGSLTHITSYTPTIAYQRYRLSSTTMPFTIYVANLLSNKVKWTHNFNGAETVLSFTQQTSLTLSPLTYNTQVGTHTLTAEIQDATGRALDAHVFVFTIDNNPKPIITANIPAEYSQEINPLSLARTFSLDISNNNASSLPNYSVRWELFYQSGGQISPWSGTPASEVQSFSNLTSTGTHTSSINFDPAVVGVGKYFLKGRITFFNGSSNTIIEERTWDVVVKNPSFGVISSATLPLPSIFTNAYHDVDYNDFAQSFHDSAYTKADYCITVTQPGGSYPNGGIGDATPPFKNILVRYYKSASDPISAYIFEGKTDPGIGKDTVCFSEAGAATQDALKYNDGTPTIAYNKEFVARVFDEQTLDEMCVKETCTSVTYPVKWNVTVHPKNKPPVATILAAQAGDNITYTSFGATTSAATVVQDSNFTIRFSLADEATPIGWNPATDTNRFRFVGELKQGVTTLDNTTCFKDFGTPTAGPNYTCTFNIPSFDAFGASGVNPPGAYTIVLTPEDSSSQVPTSSGAVGTPITWNLNVTEAQTRPVIVLNDIYDTLIGGPLASYDEKRNITFYVGVTDAQRDTYNLKIERCTDSTCATRTDFLNNSVTTSYPSTPGTLYNANSSINYTLREDEVGAVASGQVYFRISVTDIPSNPALGLPARDGSGALPFLDVSITVNNINDTPVIDPTRLTLPAVANVTAYSAFAGTPFTIQTVGGALPLASAVSDTSTVASEQVSSYQWFIRNATGPGAWNAITGATSSTLQWTPGPDLSGDHEIAFCVADGFPRTAADHTNGICSGNYLVNVKSNLSKLSNVAQTFEGEVAIHPVPSENLAYVAYVTTNAFGKIIHVEKHTYRADGTLNTSGMQRTSFRASGAALIANDVRDLSITASGNQVYVAYRSDESGTPGFFRARVRRININNSSEGSKTATAFADSTRKFDFSYTPATVTSSCAGGNCVWNPAARTITFNGAALSAGVDTITIDSTANSRSPVAIPTSVVAPTPSDSICANCNANTQASTFATAINSNATADLQGLTAVAVGNVVTLYGVAGNTAGMTAFYDGSDTITSMGRIVYNTVDSRWIVPVVNASLAGSNQNRIQILSGPDGDMVTVNTANVLAGTDGFESAVKVKNGEATTGMLIAYVTSSGSALKLINLVQSGNDYVPSSTPVTPTTAVASGVADFSLAGSPGASNPNVFVASKDVSGTWRLLRLPTNLASISANVVVDSTIGASAADDVILMGQIPQMVIRPAAPQAPATSTNEARVILISDSGSAGATYNSHAFRWYQLVTPGDTLSSNGSTLELNAEALLATSRLAVTVPFAEQLGNDGGTVGESTNFYMGVVKVNAAGATSGRAEVMFMNSETDTINASTRSPAGLFHPVYIK